MNNPQVESVCVNQQLRHNQYNTTFLDTNANLRVVIDDGNADIEYGQCYQLSGEITPIENLYYNPSSFNYSRYMLAKRIKYQIDVTDYQLVANQKTLRSRLNNFRDQLLQRNQRLFPRTSAYLNALVLGENQIDDYYRSLYGQIGISAVFAISGLHIELIYNIIITLLAKLRVRALIAKRITVLLLIIYGIFLGGLVAVNRGIIMLFFQKIIGINRQLSFWFTLLITLVYNPFNLLNKGYILSYFVMFILIYSQCFLPHNSEHQAIKLSYIIYLLTLPITYSFNYTINIVAIFFVPFLTLFIAKYIVPLAFLITLTGSVFINGLLEIGIHFLNVLVNILNLFTVYSGHVSAFIWLLYIVILYLLYVDYHKYLRFIIIWFIIVFLDVTIYPQISIIDVGQGDGILIEMPNQKNYSIDFGREAASSELVKYYKYQGVKTVDIAFLSHSHNDHYGGLETLSREVKIKHLYENSSGKIISGSTGLSQSKNIDDFAVGVVTILAGNNTGLVVKLTGEHSMLFTGDLEQAGEDYLVTNYCDQLKSDVLKVGHHGSKTSSSPEFLACINPSISVISSGRNNRYSHPDPEIVERLSETSQVYNTKENGEITIVFKPNRIEVKKQR